MQVHGVKYCMAGVRRGAFTCVGWQVTLCDPIWQVTSRSSEMGFSQEELYRPLPFTFYSTGWQCFTSKKAKAKIQNNIQSL